MPTAFNPAIPKAEEQLAHASLTLHRLAIMLDHARDVMCGMDIEPGSEGEAALAIVAAGRDLAELTADQLDTRPAPVPAGGNVLPFQPRSV